METSFWFAVAVVLASVSIHELIANPASAAFSEKTADCEGYTEQKARLACVEVIQLFRNARRGEHEDNASIGVGPELEVSYTTRCCESR